MDAFYAAVEQRDNPELKGKAVAVGWDSLRGVVATASYEARKFGVRSAMPISKAKVLCPQLIIVKPRMEAYQKVSHQVRGIFREYTDLIEPLSLDEAYLDVTDNKMQIIRATTIAKDIKLKIWKETGLTASAGISYCKFLAKIASDLNKPDGLTLIHPKKAKAFLAALEVHKFHGIGRKTADKMIELDIYTGADILKTGREKMEKLFGKNGIFFYEMARGNDHREVSPERKRKSVSVENTFIEDLYTKDDVLYELTKLAYLLEKRIRKTNFKSKTLTLKVKSIDFKTINRSKTGNEIIENQQQIMTIVESLLPSIEITQGIRLLGIGTTNALEEKGTGNENQLNLDFK